MAPRRPILEPANKVPRRAIQCPADHLPAAEPGRRYYCVQRELHGGPHLDCKGRTWKKLWPASYR